MKAAGFTLIETLVTITVVSVALLALMALMSGVLNINQRSDTQGQAVLLAQREFDSLKRVTPNLLPVSGTQEQAVTFNGRPFVLRRTYCPVPAYCTVNQRGVRVEVLSGSAVMFAAETVYTELRAK
ncbi:type IV pilus modification PilV family protein [Deinococcus knuensis]|uniref:Type II secretion system protein n=1 Tax=Deinococcus knuensis TaxID=1837380 RepID=A0ABQ2SW59_9DEIO|nr:type II secretion system protein [Deinococcus knuensis]GGS39842.1 hypothetical protein GCM10008961_33980 [Deinococcus knuensis]